MKASIRREMRAKRRALSPGEKASMDCAICSRLSGIVGKGASAVAVYLASADEIDLSQFIREMLENGVVVAVPRWNGEVYEMAALEGLEPESLRKGPMGISEPVSAKQVSPGAISHWIVPGLAFAKDGRRIGYGGGWYDRILANASSGADRIGVAYPFQVLDDLPCEEHDIRMTKVVSP